MKRPALRIALSTLSLATLALTLACEAEPEPEPPRMTVTIVSATPIGGARYRIEAEIAHFEPGAGLHGRLELYGDTMGLTTVHLDEVASAHFELDTEPLSGLTHYSATLWLADPFGDVTEDQLSWTTGPPEVTMVTPRVHDTSVLTVTGTGFPPIEGIELGLRPAPGADEVTKELFEVQCEPTACTGRLPVILATIDEPPVFTGPLLPASVYLVGRKPGSDEPYRLEVGTTELTYLAGAPEPTSGAPGSELVLPLFHPARAPNLAGLTVFFDDQVITPLAVEEQGDLSIGGWIYLTRSRYRVPADAVAGTHQLRVVTAYGEEFTYVAPDFEVVRAR